MAEVAHLPLDECWLEICYTNTCIEAFILLNADRVRITENGSYVETFIPLLLIESHSRLLVSWTHSTYAYGLHSRGKEKERNQTPPRSTPPDWKLPGKMQMVERSTFSFLDNFELWVGHDIDRGIHVHTLDYTLPKRILGDRRKGTSQIERGELLLKDGYIKNESICLHTP